MQGKPGKYSENQLIGVVACGGLSSRMGTDKSLLVYSDKPQFLEVATMLRKHCDHVVVSCRAEQTSHYHDVEVMADMTTLKSSGPIAAVLTSFRRYPGHDVLLVGCDYPNLDFRYVEKLTSSLHRSKPAAMFNEVTSYYEPLLAYYPCHFQSSLLEDHTNGNNSLQQFLRNHDARKVLPADLKSIMSVDTAAEYKRVRQDLR